MQDSALQANNISADVGDTPLLQDISFTLDPGQCLHIQGDNGVGKTTLCHILAGLRSQSDGQILWQGHNINRKYAHYCQSMIYCGHTPGIKVSLTPLEHLKFYADVTGKSFQCSAMTALERCGLAQLADTPCQQLSAGQLRRIALTRLVAFSAQLWILDEPLTALDKQACGLIVSLINQQVQEGGMVIITSHQFFECVGKHVLQLGVSAC